MTVKWYWSGSLIRKGKETVMMHRRGFTLLELLLVVGIAAILIVSGISTYNMVVSNHKVNETVTLLNLIVDKTHALYPSAEYGTANIETLLYNSRSLPNKYMSSTPGQLITPYDDSVTAIQIIGSAGPGDPNSDIDIQMRLPPAMMIRIVSQFTVPHNSIIACGLGMGQLFSIESFSPDEVSNACGSSMSIPATPNLTYYAL